MSFNILSAKFIYTEMNYLDDFEAIFKLTNKSELVNDYTVLDCQSFIQRLDTFGKHDELLNESVITYTECEELFFKYDRCIEKQKSVCIDTKDLFSNNCSCQ